VQASGVSFAPSEPHGYWRWPDHTAVWTNFKKEMWVNNHSLTGNPCEPL